MAGQPITLASGAVITVNAGGAIDYDPNGAFEALADFQSGSDSFTYAIEDDEGLGDGATVFVTVRGANDAPQAADDALIANDDTPIVANVLADNGSGPDTDVDVQNTLTVTALNGEAADIGAAVVLPSGATVTLQADGTLDYDPTTLPAGAAADSFDYTLSDGRGGTDTATVSITINPTNLAPIAQDDAVALTEDDGTSGDVLADNDAGSDTDPNGDALTVVAVNGEATDVGRAVTLPGGAVVTLQAGGTFTVSPGGGYQALAQGQSATETFTYTVEDGNGGSDVATVTLTIAGVNDAPSVPNATLTANEDGPAVTGDVLDGSSDIDDGDTRTVTAVNGDATAVGQSVAVTGGGLVTIGADGAARFDPNEAYETLDAGDLLTRSVQFTVTDTGGASVTRTLSLRVTGENDAPEAADDAFGVSEGQNLAGNLLADNGAGADGDIDASAILGVSAVNGDAAVLARPVTLASGASVTVNPNGTFTYLQNGAFAGLNAGETGSDSFTYTLRDQAGATDTATVTITVTGAADAPVAVDDVFAIDENGSVTANVLADNGVGPDFDPNGDPVSVTAVDGDPANLGVIRTLASGATVSISATGALAYATGTAFDRLAEGATATETIGYTISDGLGGTDDGAVTITLTGVNDAPVAQRDEFEVDEDAAFADNLLLNNGFGADFDVDDGDSIAVSAVNGDAAAVGTAVALASGATVTVAANGDVTYAQNGAFDRLGATQTARESFTYTIADALGVPAMATVEFTIRGVNDRPEAVDDSFSVTASGSFSGDVIAGVNAGPDTDADDGDVLSVTAVNRSVAGLGAAVTLPSGATLTLNADGSFTYDASTAGFGGSASDGFAYTVSDGRGGTDVGQVTITITEDANTPPVANPIDVAFGEDQTGRVVDLLDPAQVSDADGDDLDVTTLTLTAADDRALGFDLNAETGALALDDGGFEDLDDGETLVLTAAYGVTDGAETVAGSATITVDGANDAPTAQALAFTLGEDDPATAFDLLTGAADVDGEDLDVSDLVLSGADGRPVAADLDPETGALTIAAGQFEDLDDGETLVLTATYGVTDGTATTPTTATITIDGANDAPVFETLQTTVTVAEGTTAVGVFEARDADAGDSVTFSIEGGDDADLFDIDPTTGALRFRAAPDFETPGDAGGDNVHDVVIGASDGTATTPAAVTVIVTDIDETSPNRDPAPADDAFATDEDTAIGDGLNLFADNGDGPDSDPDGDVLTIAAVNGSAAAVGSEITLLSGAQLTVNGDGTFSYDPNGAFEALNDGETGVDSFTYTVTDGNGGAGTANATIAVAGVTDVAEPNLVLGTEGSDRLFGAGADDLIRSLGGRQDVVTGGGGMDVFDFSDSTENGQRETRTITDFEAGERIDIGAASVLDFREIGSRVLVYLDGDRDVIVVNGVGDFDDLTFT